MVVGTCAGQHQGDRNLLRFQAGRELHAKQNIYPSWYSLPRPAGFAPAPPNKDRFRHHAHAIRHCTHLGLGAVQEVQEVALEEPSGWLTVPLSRKDLSPSDDDVDPSRDGFPPAPLPWVEGVLSCVVSGTLLVCKLILQYSWHALAACLRAFMVQIAVLANHENGRDSHIRQIKVYGPRPDPAGVYGVMSAAFPLGSLATVSCIPRFDSIVHSEPLLHFLIGMLLDAKAPDPGP